MASIELSVTAQPTPEEIAETRVKAWLEEIKKALEREEDFRKEGSRIVDIYEAAKESTRYKYSILFANTETLAPALYNNPPRPVVQRRFKDNDPLGAAACLAGKRILEFLIDDGSPDYPTFDELMRSAVLQALVPGRGVTRFRYDALFERVQAVQEAEAAEASGEVIDPDEDDETALDPEDKHDQGDEEQVTYETVCGEEVDWNRMVMGYGKKWKEVPWIAYEWFMTKQELEANFGAIGAQVPTSAKEVSASDGKPGEHRPYSERESMKGVQGAWVWEIRDKRTRKVMFISESWPKGFLKETSDPLDLAGFYDCPKPLQLFSKISDLVPVPMYLQYQDQARELNEITNRINILTKALKVRGFYDSTITGMEKLFEADDTVLLPAENTMSVGSGTSQPDLSKAIWFAPIETLITVLQQLYTNRQQVKQTIYELTGIADIMRGSSQASETLGAQRIKNQWGSLRLKRLQNLVATYARDCLRLMLEIAVTKLSLETIRGMTGLPYLTREEQAQKQAQLQAIQQQMMMAQMQAQQAPAPGMDPAMGGQPPAPPQPDPQAQAQLAELQSAIAQPVWEDIIGLLQNDLQRSFRIDIETNSTVDADATEDKESITEMLTAMSQFLAGVGPLVQQGVMPFEVAKNILLTIARRFRFGDEIEEDLKQMQAPKPSGDQGAELKLQAEKMKQEFEERRMERQERLDEAKARRDEELANRKHQRELQKMDREDQRAVLELQLDERRMVAEVEAARAMPQKPAAQPQQGGQAGRRPGKNRPD